jgi:toxin ParE1/3/4
MARVVRTPQADVDLFSIIANVGRYSRSAARKLTQRVGTTCERLAANPMMGAACDEIKVGLRYFVIGKYVIYYLPSPEGIQVVRVLHGSQDVTYLSFEEGI